MVYSLGPFDLSSRLFIMFSTCPASMAGTENILAISTHTNRAEFLSMEVPSPRLSLGLFQDPSLSGHLFTSYCDLALLAMTRTASFGL
jgi:hypothetical protein